ncbi:MBL fold metallo-hydrolase [Vibrio coralliilyticus]|uniref:MBL fold metallo-hydrolase n=1 Tax=Vibrio coralliilyticus TaxID=190893 RepID=UPI002FCEAEB2
MNISLTAVATALTLYSLPSLALTQLTDNTYHFYHGHYGSLIVVGEDGVLITDPANTKRAEALKKALAEVTSKPVTHIAYSQVHFDHIGGGEVFKGAKSYMQESANQVLKYDPLGIAPDTIDITFNDHLNIDLGNVNVELHALGASDGFAASAIYVPSEKVVYSSDLYQDGKITKGKYLPTLNGVGVWAALNTISEWPLNHAIDSHSSGTSVKALYDYRDLYNDIYERVLQKLKDKRKVHKGSLYDYAYYELKEEIKLPKYKHWKQYEELSAHIQRMALSMVHAG